MLGSAQLHTIQPCGTKFQGQHRDKALRTIPTLKNQVAAAATKASADPQVGCRQQPRSSGSVPTILPRGGTSSGRDENSQKLVATSNALPAVPIHRTCLIDRQQIASRPGTEAISSKNQSRLQAMAKHQPSVAPRLKQALRFNRKSPGLSRRSIRRQVSIDQA